MSYPKSTRLYLQTIQELLRQYSWLDIKFCYKEGYHSVDRSNHNWAGLYINFVIEPALCEVLKIEAVTKGMVMSKYA